MMMRLTFATLVCMVGATVLSGCGGRAYRFADADPITRQADTGPVPVPEATDFERILFGGEAFLRRPAHDVPRVFHVPPRR